MIKRLLILFFSLTFPYLAHGYGNHQALEIINIKPVGTGSPAISSNNRIFRAYPGITYEIPVGAIGGKYPYTYSLINQPTGMTIDSKKGIITWLNPQATANNVTVRVTDVDGVIDEATWSITVGTTGFLFVDDTTDASGTGTIDDPYDSIQDILNIGTGAADSIVYFRAGTYNVPIHHYGQAVTYTTTACNLGGFTGSRAHIWIGYPGETVNLQLSGAVGGNADWIGTYEHRVDNMWFSNLTINGGWHWGVLSGPSDYLTVYDTIFNDVSFTDVAGNSGGIGIYPAGETKDFFYIGHSSFSNFTHAAFIGSIYTSNKLLIEFNTFGSRYEAGSDVAIKSAALYSTVRANVFNGGVTQYSLGSSSSGNFAECNYNEITFNYINTSKAGDFNTGHRQLTTWVERNTIGGPSGWNFRDTDYPDLCGGPFYFEDNVFDVDNNAAITQGTNSTSDYAQCVTLINNSVAASGLIDTEGKLLASTYIGLRGWQLADGTTPLEPASGMTITCWQDSDNDLYGSGSFGEFFDCPMGYYTASHFTSTTSDCNDTNGTINPGGTETCGDGIDQDCSGSDLTCTPTPARIRWGTGSVGHGTGTTGQQ